MPIFVDPESSGHLEIPNFLVIGGLRQPGGVNTRHRDAIDLAWKLKAVVAGDAREDLATAVQNIMFRVTR